MEQELIHGLLSTEQVAMIEDHHVLTLHLHGQVPVPHDVHLDVLLLDQQYRRDLHGNQGRQLDHPSTPIKYNCLNIMIRKGSLLLWVTSTVPRMDLQMLVLIQIMSSFDIPENLSTPE